MATATTPAVPAKLTPEEIERHWFENVYQGDKMKQLTLRAVVMGCGLGMIMACSNVYVGLKAGWGMGVAITSCILAYTIFSSLHKLLPRQFPDYTILENNAMQSSASAAGAITSAGLVNAIPALIMLQPDALPHDFAHRCLYLIPWLTVISWLGVFLAVPAKRQMINIEQLPFPSGTAAASTLKSLHSAGHEAAEQARLLFTAAGVGGITTWLRDSDFPRLFHFVQPAWLPGWGLLDGFTQPKSPWLSWLWLPRIRTTWGTNWLHIGKYDVQSLTMSLEGSLLFVAAGAIMSFRQAWSLMLGACINYLFLAPLMLDQGVIASASFRKISGWSLWTGVPMMVTSGLLLFFMNWKTVIRAFGTITAFLGGSGKKAADDPMEKIEVPGSWFLGGFAVLGLLTIILGVVLFKIHWWMGLIAVLATFLLVIVAARATGETDITPVGPLSKITQLTFGAISPGNITTNLMTANISAGATSSAGDLLTDLKSGYLLGANPRQQFLAQFFGVFFGALIVVPVFFILIPDMAMLGTEKWPAPAALVWRGVAELLSKGVESLPPTARIGLLVGAALGILLPVLEMLFPRHKKFIPSATGLGLAFTINGFNSISMFIGAGLVLWFRHVRPKLAEKYTVPVASGIIAGESLMGVAIAMITILLDRMK